VKPNFSAIYLIGDSGSGQFFEPGQIYPSPGFAKIAPWYLASRDKLPAKVPGPVVGWTAPPTLSAHTRQTLAARHIYPKSSLYLDFRRARKSFAALPCNHPVAAKHMLFCLRTKSKENTSIQNWILSLVDFNRVELI
jgi:hypothetical protein